MTAPVDVAQAHQLRHAEAEWLRQSAARLRAARAAARGDHADRARPHAVAVTETEDLR